MKRQPRQGSPPPLKQQDPWHEEPVVEEEPRHEHVPECRECVGGRRSRPCNSGGYAGDAFSREKKTPAKTPPDLAQERCPREAGACAGFHTHTATFPTLRSQRAARERVPPQRRALRPDRRWRVRALLDRTPNLRWYPARLHLPRFNSASNVTGSIRDLSPAAYRTPMVLVWSNRMDGVSHVVRRSRCGRAQT